MDTVTDEQKTDKKSLKSVLKRFRKPGKHMFWAWIAYQAVKGSLTTAFIWIPLIYAWLH